MSYKFEPITLAAATADLNDEVRARKNADIVEFRIDLADRPLDALDEYDGELPLIATNRAEWEGGEAKDNGRIETLVRAITHKAVEAVDIELVSIEDGEGGRILKAAAKHNVTVIVSKHNFNETPTVDEMDRLLAKASKYGDVAKLAVTAHNEDDTLRLLQATRRHTKQGRHVATMSMGEIGGHTRAIAGLYGSRIGYAPVKPDKATAPGQYDLETLARLIDELI